MASQRQFEANRANARRGTGPRSSQGKARARMNAVKHGLTAARCVLIEGEDPEEFEALCADLIAKYRPSTAFRHELVIQLAVAIWRFRRVGGLEAAFVRACQEETSAEVEASLDEAYYQPLREKADRRCAESFGNRLDPILRAKLDGRYDSRFEKYFEEAQAEALERGCKPPNRKLTTDELAQAHQAAVVEIFLHDERSDALRKLGRYETSLLNNIFRIFRLLEAEEKLTKVIDA
jgi:hypothetical protein